MFERVEEFERVIADFFGAKYFVATDCCTHAVELGLRLTQPQSVTVPCHTYISIPFTLIKVGIPFAWDRSDWQDHYHLGGTDIIDAAAYWQAGGYVPGSLMCLSFQQKKHLKLGRGGGVLCQDLDTYQRLKRMSYDGRDLSRPWAEQDVSSIGYHYYMTPETAEQGLRLFDQVKDLPARNWSSQDYPDLTRMSVFQ